MANKFTQSNRHARIYTPLGDDVLLFKGMQGTERLGCPYQYDLVLLSEQPEINYKEIIGQNVTLTVDKRGEEPRFFNGYISRFEQVQFEGELREYRATMVPWLWFLTRSSDCRIFQNLTIPEIIHQVFKNHGFGDISDRLHDEYPKREFCVQYRETAFNFVSRLMEEEGIYYYFKHEDGKHTIVLCESIGSHLQFAGYEYLDYRPRPRSAGTSEIERLWGWKVHREVQPGSYHVNGFDFENPKKDLLRNHAVARQHAASEAERYDYGGEFKESAHSERQARRRLEELQAGHEVFSGNGDARGSCTGVRFTLKGHPGRTFEREYLTTGVDYQIETGNYTSDAAENRKLRFEVKLWATPSDQPFRSPSTARKPEITGPQTAMVVGPAGEEIHTDKYGRVKLKFHWDRHSKADENSSCWVRVAQAAAGKAWGSIYIPRVGQEVIVEFLDGDPDHPIITGRVYNGGAMPPYELPANKTISAHKSSSSKGGAGFNEIRLEDKKGEEQIFIHGEKNQDIRIKNDAFEWIGNDRHLVVKNDQVENVENDRHEKITRDHVEEIGRDHHLTLKGKEAIKITGSQSVTVEDDVIEVFKKNQSTQVTKDLYIKGENIVIEATNNITINVGESYIAIESGGIKMVTNGDIIIEAKGSITQKATQDVKIEATANASMKGTAGLKLESPAPAELSSSAILTLKGSLVKIN